MPHNQEFDKELTLPPGLQTERTSIAWNRTALAFLVNGLLLLRSAVKLDSLLFGVLSILMFIFTVFMHRYLRSLQQKTLSAKEANFREINEKGIYLIPAKIITYIIASYSIVLVVYFISQSCLNDTIN